MSERYFKRWSELVITKNDLVQNWEGGIFLHDSPPFNWAWANHYVAVRLHTHNWLCSRMHVVNQLQLCWRSPTDSKLRGGFFVWEKSCSKCAMGLLWTVTSANSLCYVVIVMFHTFCEIYTMHIIVNMQCLDPETLNVGSLSLNVAAWSAVYMHTCKKHWGT